MRDALSVLYAVVFYDVRVKRLTRGEASKKYPKRPSIRECLNAALRRPGGPEGGNKGRPRVGPGRPARRSAGVGGVEARRSDGDRMTSDQRRLDGGVTWGGDAGGGAGRQRPRRRSRGWRRWRRI
uniref:Hypothetical_protein n=1 Tax=Oryza glaberrima TaxID=4538 RepID=G2XLK3_ORYGL|nr:hypothetical_protein [Oryza glaberrima]